MSMNFAREQSLLRQRLQAKASPGLAAARAQQHAGVTFLGAPDDEVAAAAVALAAAWPQMGRAQMTAFVRTLWGSRIHELRAVGVQLLANRAALLEPADLPLLEGFLKDDALDAVMQQLARDVLGAVVVKNKKLWRELKRLAGGTHPGLRLAGVRGAALALASDAEAFPRFTELVAPLLADADPALQAAIDEVLVAAAELHRDAVQAFVQQHARRVTLPRPRAVPPPVVAPAPAAPAKAATKPPVGQEPAPARKAATKPAVRKPAARKAAAPKPAAQKPAAQKPAAAKAGKAASRAR